MSVNVIAHDTRLVGRTPSPRATTITFEVDDETSIHRFFDRCRSIAVEHDGIDILSIMAHGLELRHGSDVGGGYGIQFCRELITLENVDLFALLADKVRHIDLYVCYAAAVSPDIYHLDLEHPETAGAWRGDGNELCRQMAIRAQASVTASADLQAYSPSDETRTLFGYSLYSEGDMAFGEWEGTVITYNSNGEMIDRRVFPTAWRTPDGDVHDPRLETRPVGL